MIRYNSYIRRINKDLAKEERLKISKAADFLKQKLKEKIEILYGKASDLYKGAASSKSKSFAKVGMGRPAYHAHLLEFGTDDRYTKTGKFSGHVAPRPFVFPTFEENADEVEKIISETWL